VGFQEVVLWQLTQAVVVVKCCAFLPAAELPLWQLAQVVELLNRLWSTFAPAHVEVDLWQLSQVVWPLWMVVLGLPVRPKLVVA
jgi:hypothetical protein